MGKDQDLLEACRTGNVTTVEKLLAGRLGNKARGSKGAGALSSFSKSLMNLKSANVNCVDTSGDTPLHLAALNGHKEIVTILLECEASTNVQDSRDCSPLHLAAWSGHTDICNQLMQSSDGLSLINLQTRDGNTALHFAAQHGHLNALSCLLQKKSDPTIRNLEDLSPLDLAAQYDRLEIVKQLVSSHPELLAQRSFLQTPLHLASRNGHRAVVQYLLDSGFPVDAKTEKGTALHEASNFCKLDVIKLLLERGVDITVKSQRGSTAEDILNNIPSKTAEDALGIMKSHIYHQRTPDSDGERGILHESPTPGPRPVTQPDNKQSSPALCRASISKPLVIHGAEKLAHLHASLPPTTDLSVPPPIPPRQSLREPIKQDNSTIPALPPLRVPREKDAGKENMKGGLSASPKGAGSRESSPATSRSPLEMPKKPPRKKPQSFRRPDPVPAAASSSAVPTEEITEITDSSAESSNRNYINIDPFMEKARLDGNVPNVSSDTGLENGNGDISVIASQSKVSDPQCVHPDVQTNVQTEIEDDHQNVHHVTKEIPSVIKTQPSICDNQESDDIASKPTPPQTLSIENSESDQKTNPPTSPSKIVQPPTPDCPPPSPSTAILDIQKKIQPMEKRKSQDVETLTDVSVAGGPTSQASRTSTDIGDVHADLINVDAAKKLTPVTEEGALAGGKPLKPMTEDQPPPPLPKAKPKPLPRKSSLGSQSFDTSSSTVGETAAVNEDCEVFHPEGYGGALPISGNQPQGRVLRKQDPVNKEMLDDQDDRKAETAVAAVQSDEPVTVEVYGESVQLRRSSSTGNETDSDWQGHIFADLLRGSVIGGARDVVHQLCNNNDNINNNNNVSTTATAAGASNVRKKRKSTSSNCVTSFPPVMEEDKDVDPDQIIAAFDDMAMTSANENNSANDNNNDIFDDESEWDQINATLNDFGVGLGRESAFVEETFVKFITADKVQVPAESKLQSVGEWLAAIGVPQYENAMVANGLDDTDFLSGSIMEDQDLNAIGVTNPTDRKTILEAASQLVELQPIDPDNLPVSVAEWLGSLRLDYYLETFSTHKYDTMERVINLWELELVTVLDISSIGHRKRILASLGDCRPETPSSAIKVRVPSMEGLGETKSPFDHVDLYRDYTGVRSRVPSKGGVDSSQDSLDEMVSTTQGTLDQSQGKRIRDSSVHIRDPHMVQYTGSIKQWRHKPEVLIKGCCNYTAHYLGSTLVKELKGPISTQEGIAKLKKSSEVISKIPSIVLSISFKGVKFIDAMSKKVVCDHEITNIFCACQDAEHMNFFAYITKDKDACKCYCHVFSVRSKELAGEIILTLGQAFEIAYQMVLKEKAQKEADDFEKQSSVTSMNAEEDTTATPIVSTSSTDSH